MLSIDSDGMHVALFAVEVDLPHLARAGQGKDGQLRVGLQQGNTDDRARLQSHTRKYHTATLVLTNTNCFLRFSYILNAQSLLNCV